jgi:hypothetical protein
MAYTYPTTIFDAIRQERQDFLYNTIQIVDGFFFSQYQTIKKIHKYYNGHYSDGDYETINGITRKKVFWTIGKRRATIASKQIDIDTKDFLLIPENQATEWNVFLLEKELKAWLTKKPKGKENRFSAILNQIADELPVYGSCVLRKTKEGSELIDLRYFFCEQSADNLKKSRYKIIKHFMTPEELRKMDAWTNTKEAIEKFAQSSFKSYEDAGQLNIQHGTPYVEVYERYAEVPRSYFENDGVLVGDGSESDDDFVYGRFIVAGVDAVVGGSTVQPQAPNPNDAPHSPGIILFSEELSEDDDPFKEVHFRKTRGRWLGIGVIEDTFEDQRMVNKTKDQEDKAAELASLILFQTATDMVAKNILTDVDNGEILKAAAPINRLDNQNKALGEMQTLAKEYELHADRETFSADLLGGEAPPASATLGAVNQQTAMSAGVYDYKKENFGIFLTDFIQDLVFPDLQKKIMSPHVLRFSGDMQEMAKLRERVVDGYLRQQILSGNFDIPTDDEYKQMKQKYLQLYQKQGSQMWIDIEKDFFKNLDYELSLEVTGESKNVQTWLNNVSAVLKMIQGNPLALMNPLTKRLIFKMLSAMGMSISELENAEAEITQEMYDMMFKMGQRRTLRQNIDFKDVPKEYQAEMLEGAGMNPPQQQPQMAQQGNNQGQQQ